MALHAGANLTNDYFDHLTGNDWLNQNPTPFSGGSRFIQNGIISPRTILILALSCLAIGSIIGIVIVLLTKSLFILILGIIGLLGGFFYTAAPVKLGYRSIGELVIFFLFGILPVYASYYLQTKSIDMMVLLPACIVGLLIFLVILINEFGDLDADAAVNKKTIIVCLGLPAAIWIYRISLITSYLLAAITMFIYKQAFYAGLFYLFTLPLAIAAIRFANKKDLTEPGRYSPNRTTIQLHTLGTLALTIGFLIFALTS